VSGSDVAILNRMGARVLFRDLLVPLKRVHRYFGLPFEMDSSRQFAYRLRAGKRRGFGWNRWCRAWFYATLGLFYDYGVL